MTNTVYDQIAQVEQQHRFALHPEQFAAPGYVKSPMNSQFKIHSASITSGEGAIPYCGMADHTHVWAPGWRAQPIANLSQ